MARRVVVTGFGALSSIGIGEDAIVDSLRNARSGIERCQDYADMNFASQVFAPVKGFNPAERFDRKQLRFMGKGRTLPLVYAAMQDAVTNSGLTAEQVSHDMTGLLVGTGGPSTEDQCDAAIAVRNNRKDPNRKSLSRVLGIGQVPPTMSSGASAILATDFKIRGISFSLISACATSAHCIGEAYYMIQAGRQDVMFAGGGDDAHWTKAQGFDAMGALSKRYNNTPAVASRAYDINRDGFVDAEGAGIVVLELLEHAKARGATILAEVVGYGATSDGHSMVEPSGEGAARCMELALGDIRHVDYLNTHGTSTPVGDSREIGAVRAVFNSGELFSRMPRISSTKSLTGHALGGAGSLEAIYSLLMMKHRFLCVSAHIEELDPEFADVPVIQKRIDDAKVDVVMSNSFGFGGTNASLVFRRYNG